MRPAPPALLFQDAPRVNIIVSDARNDVPRLASGFESWTCKYQPKPSHCLTLINGFDDYSFSQAHVQSGVTLVTRTGEALQKIGGHVQSINSNVKAMVTSSQEQSVGIQEINTAINQMDQVTQQNAAMVEETTAAVHTVFGETETLNQAISRFKLSGQARGRTSAEGRARAA